jgi:hypothetical protein
MELEIAWPGESARFARPPASWGQLRFLRLLIFRARTAGRRSSLETRRASRVGSGAALRRDNGSFILIFGLPATAACFGLGYLVQWIAARMMGVLSSSSFRLGIAPHGAPRRSTWPPP